MNTYIDIGINLTNKQFQNDTETIVHNALDADVTQMILTGTSVKASQESAQIAKNYPDILYATAGIHPHNAKSFDATSCNQLKVLLQKSNVVAVGECGLDFDRDFSPRNIQEQCFNAQLELAITIQKPLFLHEREAFERFIEIINDHLPQLPKAVVHCFTGSLNQAKTYLDKGFYLGFTGAITDTNRFAHLKEVLQYVPLDRIMIETDSPFMLAKNVPKSSITKYHERRNEPAFLPFVAATVAQYKNVSLVTVAEETSTNSRNFFGL